MKRNFSRLAVVALALAALAVIVWTMAGAVSAGDRPECPPGLVCEWPTQTPPAEVTSEPYPPPEPQPTPEPYPYPAGHARPTLGERVYLSPVMGEGEQP